MKKECYFEPKGRVDVVLDTDAYNEVDDQFAIAYLLRSKEKLNTVAIYAAPFYNSKSTSPEDGMKKSYDEILHILHLCGEDALKESVFYGSTTYLLDEQMPVISAAAEDLVSRAMHYTNEAPLYVVAIGAITNVASALLMKPEIKERIVVIWLGGNAHHWDNTAEFNMKQDYAAARIVISSGVPFVQLPCSGVVSDFHTTKPELEYWLVGKNPLADYLARNTIAYMDEHHIGLPWSKVIWDVTATAWLLNENGRFMKTRVTPARLPDNNGQYMPAIDQQICYVYGIHRDTLMRDMIQKLLE